MSGSQSSAQLAPLTGFRMVRIKPGDTLQGIAAAQLGDATKWPVLAALNALLPPYIIDDLSQLGSADVSRVLLAGMSLRVPSPGRAPTGVLDAADLYGTDLDLTDGKLSAGPTGDLLLVAGAPNLEQALDIRLEVRTGELLFHPAYGNRMWELIGTGTGPAADQLAAGYAARCLGADPRISGTRNVSAQIVGDTITVEAIAVAIDGKHVPVGGE